MCAHLPVVITFSVMCVHLLVITFSVVFPHLLFITFSVICVHLLVITFSAMIVFCRVYANPLLLFSLSCAHSLLLLCHVCTLSRNCFHKVCICTLTRCYRLCHVCTLTRCTFLRQVCTLAHCTYFLRHYVCLCALVITFSVTCAS